MADKKDETYIDPNFFLPPNVYDLGYVNKDEVDLEPTGFATGADDGVSEEVVVNASEDLSTDTAPESASQLPIPETITVVSQTVKAAAGGGYLVDLIIEIPDMNGVENYDVAVTKA